MSGYYKKTAYLDYLENGMKVRNVGFIRLEENAGTLRMDIRIRNAPEDLSGPFALDADTGGLVGRILLEKGAGGCRMVWRMGALPPGVCRKETGGVCLRLPGQRLIRAAWDVPLALAVETGLPAAAREEKAVLSAASREDRDESPVAAAEVKAAALSEISAAYPADGGSGDAAKRQESGLPAPDREEPVCYGDKWTQLCHMYPVIHPFGDEREYLSVAPRDFVVLRQDFQKLVHNSFLLHGYYNYRHLILGRVPARDGWRYYLGVPGNFYEREKMAAEMFGFEAFEGEKEQAGPGDFGYYMKKVEL